MGANPYQDRPTFSVVRVKDTTQVSDAFRDKNTGKFFDARDVYAALPRVLGAKTPYVGELSGPSNLKPLAGLRIGVIRELMVKDNSSDAAVQRWHQQPAEGPARPGR